MVRSILAAVFAVITLTGVAAPATADTAAVSCYGGAINLTYRYNANAVEYGPYTTTSRCRDINMRLTTDIPGVYLAACVVFVDHTNKCNNNDAYQIFGPPWGTVATDVKDGTHFKLRVHAYDTDAQLVNFKLAF